MLYNFTNSADYEVAHPPETGVAPTVNVVPPNAEAAPIANVVEPIVNAPPPIADAPIANDVESIADVAPPIAEDTVPKCILCLDERPLYLIMPCRHVGFCFNCNDDFWAHVQQNEEDYGTSSPNLARRCPTCREYVSETILIFW